MTSCENTADHFVDSFLTRTEDQKRFQRVFRVLVHWQAMARQRHQLRQLADDSDRLADIGISRGDALQESKRPFWD